MSSALKYLLDIRLIKRVKHHRHQKDLTLDERLGFVPRQMPLGKRPYIYYLTLPGRRIARDLEKLNADIYNHMQLRIQQRP